MTAFNRSFVRADLQNVQVRDSGAGDGSFTIVGHAAVYNRLSHDLGGFREKIDPGAFARSLERQPDVLAVWDHDTRYVLARTTNNTLELSEDDTGLRAWMRVAPTSYAQDLRVLMERGDIDQASFMFTIAQERADWTGNDEDPVVFTIEEIGDLYDVTVTGRGAYPQTTMSVEGRSARLTNALQQGRAHGLTLDLARERGLIVEEPEAEPVRVAEARAAAELLGAEQAQAEHQHRVAVERARRSRAA